MAKVPDAEQRKTALDITRSFLVQAPAGSGKTELLTQRFLTLLAQVEAPEEIIAITFTQKAAAEMRTRVVTALKNAQTDVAKNALQHSEKRHWHIQSHPNRLRILTLDALSLHIAQQLPISSKLGAQLNIAEHPTELYRQAIQTILFTAPEGAPWLQDLQTLCLHVDNRYDQIEKLLIELLAQREQWLPLICAHHEYRTLLEQELRHLSAQALKRVNNFCGSITTEMLSLADYAKNYLGHSQTQATISQAETWQFVADMLLTKEGAWRKKADKSIGFPAPSSSKNQQEKKVYAEYKQRYLALMQALEKEPAILEWFREIRRLPPTQYNENQWQVLAALLTLLPLTAAQLRLTFAQQNQIDYSENAQSALYALGDAENPSDLSLQLDYKIQHLLVDEFQDTSTHQFQLLQKITAGWAPGDGRTLFLVGDPMQSIYRFRQAEVSLFLHAKHYGIGDIVLEFLALNSNFRSTPPLVAWINHIFTTVFPRQENMPLGAIPYKAAYAAQSFTNNSETPAAECHYFTAEPGAEENYVIKKIKKIQENYPDETIAILIRTRDQMQSIAPKLQAAAIPYHAVDIVTLAHAPVIQDLLSLTRAYLHLADRIAWLACLRAPWCGLCLQDLWVVARDSKEKMIWQQLNNESVCQALTVDGQQRVHHFCTAMRCALEQRQRLALRDILEAVWERLGAVHAYPEATTSSDQQQFFNTLENITDLQGVIQYALLEKKIEKLFAVTRIEQKNSVQIMTIHKAKGLEFDHVFLPKLQKKVPALAKPLIAFLEYVDDQEIHHFLMAPMSELHGRDKLYDYLQYQQQQKLLLEMDRLLYVAVTRAKKHVYLTATGTDEAPSSQERSLLGRLAAHHPHLFCTVQASEAPHTGNHTSLAQKLWQRFPIERIQALAAAQQPLMAYSTMQENLPALPDAAVRLEAKIGTIIHQLLEQIARQGLEQWQALPKKKSCAIIQALCVRQAIAQPTVVLKIERTIATMLQDPRGQWILQPHLFAGSEYPIRYYQDNVWKQCILDRLLLDEDGTYWIIDYKTMGKTDPEQTLSDFLEQAVRDHQAQLQRYVLALRSLIPTKKIQAALYFPTLPAWKMIIF